MKPSNELKAVLSVCEKLADERVKLENRLTFLTGAIDTAILKREARERALGNAVADGDSEAIAKARTACREADLDHTEAVQGKQAVAAKLADVLARAKEPAAELARQTELWRDSVFAELQGEVAKQAELFAATARRALAVADGLGVSVLPIGALTTLAGVTEPIALDLGWRADHSAVKARGEVERPMALVRDFERLEAECRHRALIARGHASQRPPFSSVAHHHAFEVTQPFKHGEREFQPGELFSADLMAPDLLRMMYQQHRISVRHPSAA